MLHGAASGTRERVNVLLNELAQGRTAVRAPARSIADFEPEGDRQRSPLVCRAPGTRSGSVRICETARLTPVAPTPIGLVGAEQVDLRAHCVRKRRFTAMRNRAALAEAPDPVCRGVLARLRRVGKLLSQTKAAPCHRSGGVGVKGTAVVFDNTRRHRGATIHGR